MARGLFSFMVMALALTVALAADHSPLQDFCVADMSGQGMLMICLLINGIMKWKKMGI